MTGAVSASYTVDDTPDVVERIERDLESVVATVRESDPALRSLVLTGGFARGEGAMRDGQPQNDYDFVALRGFGHVDPSYERMAHDLEDELGLHIDLAPVSAWRLRWVAPSIFWYETALRGRVLWGEDLLDRIPVRRPEDIDPGEGLRLLVNRAAGLLLVRGDLDEHEHRIQASKALLGAADVYLLADGDFPPSQTERWRRIEEAPPDGSDPDVFRTLEPWLRWAYEFKTRPEGAEVRDAQTAWQVAAQAVNDAVPAALRHAGLTSLDAYGRRDGLLDHLVYVRRARHLPGARRWLRNPTGQVRVATLRLLEACVDGTIRPEAMHRFLGPIVDETDEPMARLRDLRAATLQ